MSKSAISATRLDRLIAELLSTEEQYVACLQGLLHYKTTLVGEVLSAEECSSVFLNVQTLHSVHSGLLTQLKQGSPTLVDVVAAFLSFTPYLKVTAQYSNGFDQAQEFLRKLKWTRPEFLAAVEAISWGASTCGMFGLTNMLITPVQRIPRYRMFFGEFLKYTPTDAPHYQKVYDAYFGISGIARHLEQKRKDRESLEKMAQLAQRIAGSDMSPLYEPDVFSELEPDAKSHAFRVTEVTEQEMKCDFCTQKIEPAARQRSTLAATLNFGGVAAITGVESQRCYYRCKDCQYCVHQRCYTRPPPTCGKPRVHPSLLKVGRTILYQQYVLYKMLGSLEEMQPALFCVLTDGVMLVDQDTGALVDFCYYLSLARHLHTHDLYSYGSFFGMGSPSGSLHVYVIYCSDASRKARLLSRIALCTARWEHSRAATTKHADSRRAAHNPTSKSRASKRAHQRLLVSTKGQGKNASVSLTRNNQSVERSYKQMLRLHEALRQVYDERGLPPFPEKKLLGDFSDGASTTAVEVYLKGVMMLPDVQSRPEVRSFFGSLLNVSDSTSAAAKMFPHGSFGLSYSSASFGSGASGNIPVIPAIVAQKIDRTKLQEALDTPLSLIFFRKYLENVDEVHLLDFYFDVQTLRSLNGLKQIRDFADQIFVKYIRMEASRTLHLPLTEGQVLALCDSFKPDSDVISFSSVFNDASASVFDWLAVKSHGKFVQSEEWKELLRATSQDEVSLRGVKIHTQIATIAGHPVFKVEFEEYTARHYIPELWRGWRELHDIRELLAILQRDGGRVVTGGEEEHQDIRKKSMGAFGVKMTSMTSLFSAVAPPLPSVSFSTNHNLHLVYNYLQYWHDMFMLDESDMCITFTVECKVCLREILAKLKLVVDDFPDDEVSLEVLKHTDFGGLTTVNSEMEVNLSNHLLLFVAEVEKERMRKISVVSGALHSLEVPAQSSSLAPAKKKGRGGLSPRKHHFFKSKKKDK